ncbi:MAG: IPT/TIG domain-containing protein, partial [Chromatiales bacterium]
TTVTASATPIDLQEGAATRYRISFSRTPGSRYEVRIDDARNLRGGGLWHPFVWHGTAAAAGALRPVITDVENGVFHRGDNREVRIIGSGFRDDSAVEVFVDQYLIPHQWIDANTLYLAPGAIEQLPLQDGLHHVRVSDSGLDAYFPGSILIGAEPDLATFAMAPDSGQVEGGGFVYITSNTPVILPGSKVIMRSREGEEIRTEEVSPGVYIVNLEDDVKGLTEMRFRLPGVLPPDLLYDVYLSSAGKELFVGSFSYTLDAGRGIELPNYPPMVIGGAETVGDTLFVGVKAGSPPTEENRFLMQSGFEIYDIGIWDRPIRLAQLPTAQPVTGVATFGGVAYLASGSDGLLEVDIQDLSAPQIVRAFGVPGNSATDVAIHKGRSILAMSVANSLGSGYIRFFDLHDSELDAPSGYGTIALSQDELRGQPVDIQWQGDRLYLLLQRDEQLYLVIFDDVGGSRTHSIQVIDRAGAPDSLDEASFVVQYGQIGISNGEEFLILQPDDQNGFETVYWQAINSTGSELFLNQGGLFQAGSQGIKDTPTPNLAVTSITPPSGSDLTPSDVIRIQLNELFNTDEAELRSALTILDSLAAPLPANTYTLTGVNTLAGGYIDIAFDENLSYTGPLELQLDSNLSALNGRNLVQAVEAGYNMGSGIRPRLDYVARVDNDIAGLHYFHADATELAELQGSGFGSDAGALRILLGVQEVDNASIVSVTDNRVRFNVPNLYFGSSSASLAVTLVRDGVAATRNGAIVIQPRLELQEVYPNSGPPQGGGTVDLYGRGFNNRIKVFFGGAQAGDVSVLSSTHLQLRAPSGAFGPADVTVESELFPGESSVLPDGYFYAGRETGSVNLQEAGSPVSAIALKGQILYAVTGGGYEAIDRKGQVLGYPVTANAQLVVSDISDPVHPILVSKELVNETLPYHFKETLPPDGFREIALAQNDLFLAGGNRLYHFDVTLAADPLLLHELSFPETLTGLVVEDDLVYVAGGFGVRILRLQVDRTLVELSQIDTTALGGTPSVLDVTAETLRVMLPSEGKVVEIGLADGDFSVDNAVDLLDTGGNRFEPADMLVRNDLLMVSSGSSGSVVLYAPRPDNTMQAVAQLSLAYLIQNGDLFAGDLLLSGQTLYVASGQGDVQLFDISSWLDGDYRRSIGLGHYFTVTGSVNALALAPDAIYAGSAYVTVDGEPAENPLEVGAQIGVLGGALKTILNDQLTIVRQIPEPRGVLPADGVIEVQFNRILDPALVSASGDALFEVTLSGSRVEGFVSSQVNNEGTRLFFRPLLPFLDGREYRVTLSAALADLHGERLADDYSFRFVASDHEAPVLEDLQPHVGSWRGGEEITLTGEHFDLDTQVFMRGVAVPAENILSVTTNEIRFLLPALSEAPAANTVVGVAVANDILSDFHASLFTYVTDPLISAIGGYDPLAEEFNPAKRRFLFNAGEYAAIEGDGLSYTTSVRVNGRLVNEVRVEDSRRLSFQIPADTVGPLTVSVSNLANEIDRDSDESLRVDFESFPRIDTTNKEQLLGSYRAGDYLMLTLRRKLIPQGISYLARFYSTRDSAVPVLLSTIDLGEEITHAALSERYAMFRVGPRHELVSYDLSNIYAPEFMARILNPQSIAHERIRIFDETFVAQTAGEVHIGHVRGPDWQ